MIRMATIRRQASMLHHCVQETVRLAGREQAVLDLERELAQLRDA
jgi:hypothetical protein